MPHPFSRSATRRRFVWLCVAVGLVGFIVGLGGSALTPRRAMETHEIFVAQTARQMLAAHEWVLPSFNERLRLNKPPLMYWAVMGTRLASGAPDVLPWVARFPSAVASAVMALATVWLGRSLVNASVGVLAALIGCGSVGWVAYANNARPEMLYAACCAVMTACFAAVWRRGEDGEEKVQSSEFKVQIPDRRTGAIAIVGWLFGGLAVLAKGPQLPIVLLLGWVAFAAAEGELGRLRRLRPWVGLPLMLGVPLPWATAVLLRAPGGWRAWTADLFAGRAGEPGVSVWDWLNPYYLYGIPGLLAPWCVLLPLGVWWAFRGGKGGHPERWGGRLAVWLLVVPGLVMSLTIHRRDYYMLALMPPMAVLVAAALWSWRGGLQRTERQRRGWLYAVALIVAAAGFAAAAWPGAWSTRRERMNAFAREAAGALERRGGPDTPVLALGVDEAFLVYARNGPVPEAASPEAASAWFGQHAGALLTNGAGWHEFARAYMTLNGRVPDAEVLAQSAGGRDGVQLILIKPPD